MFGFLFQVRSRIEDSFRLTQNSIASSADNVSRISFREFIIIPVQRTTSISREGNSYRWLLLKARALRILRDTGRN